MVALIEDEPDLVAMASAYLDRDGFGVVSAGDVRAGAALLRAQPVDLLVLDLGLPDGNGLDLLRGVRAGRHLPVIILTGWAAETERVVGLELGADDYVVKPFSLPELAARIRAVLRRTHPIGADGVIHHGRLTVDPASREARVDGQPLPMTPLEFGLLALLAAAPRQVFTPAQVLEQVWGSQPGRQASATVAEHVYRLRRKLTTAGLDLPRIVTVRGVGYRMDV